MNKKALNVIMYEDDLDSDSEVDSDVDLIWYPDFHSQKVTCTCTYFCRYC